MGSFSCAAIRAVVVMLALLAIAFGPSLSSADEGWASWYGEPFHGRHMYNGQIYDMYDPTTTACNIYPIGTWVKVTSPANGRSVVVQVRDRGAFKHALDLSYAAFKILDDPAKMMIRVQYEVVPGPGAAASAATPSAKPTPIPTPSPAPTPAPTATPATPKATLTPATPPAEYVVAPGDSLIGIAQRFGLDAAAVARWNELADPDLLVVGQRLLLRAPAVTPSATTSSRGPSSPGAMHPSPGRVHIVAEGDTLWDIATKYGTTPEELAALNGLTDASIIVIDQHLRLPGGSDEATPAAAASASPGRYAVEPGDTLLAIALKYDTTVATLMRINGLEDPDLLQIGQVLALP